MVEETCNVDDLMCQIGVVSHLRGLQGLLGDERFKTEFPEFEGLGDKISEKIQTQEASLRDAFKNCGLSEPTGAVEPAEVEL